MLICPEASSAQNIMAAVSADGSTVCVLILRLNPHVVLQLGHVFFGRRFLREWQHDPSPRRRAHRRPETTPCISITAAPPVRPPAPRLLLPSTISSRHPSLPFRPPRWIFDRH